MAPASAFVVEGAGAAGVDGLYVRDDFDWRHADFGKGADRRPQVCCGADVFRKAGTSFALLRKGNEGWALADLKGSAANTWTLRSVQLYFAPRTPAGPTPPPFGWSSVDGASPAPLVQPAKAAPILPALATLAKSKTGTTVLARTGHTAIARASSEPRLPRPSRAKLTLAVLGVSSAEIPAQPRSDPSTYVCIFRVTLVRQSPRISWGFQFLPEPYNASGTRLLSAIEPDSPLSRWNMWQDVRKRHALCVTPGDRLVRVDGCWAYHDAEVSRRDADNAKQAIAADGHTECTPECIVLDFARPVMRPPRPPAPRLEAWEASPPMLVVDWKAAADAHPTARGWALCLQDLDQELWYVVDGCSTAASPLATHYGNVGAFRPDQTAAGLFDGLAMGSNYSICIAVLTEKGWSAFSEFSRLAFLRVDAGQLGSSAIVDTRENWADRPRFALPRDLVPGTSAPIELSPGPSELLGAGRRLRLRSLLRGIAGELRQHVRPTGGNSALLVDADIEAGPNSPQPLLFHGAAVSTLPLAGDVIVRVNGISGAPQMFAEIKKHPEVLAVTLERWAGGTSSDAVEDSSPETAFLIDQRLDSNMVRTAEEMGTFMLSPEEGVLVSRITESDPDKLEDALRRFAVATEMKPPLKPSIPGVMEDAERRLVLMRRVNAALAEVHKQRLSQCASKPSDEQAVVVLRKAMANVALNEEDLQLAIKGVAQASQAVRNSATAVALVERAQDLLKLWQWRRRSVRAHRQLLDTLEDALQHEADVRSGMAGPADEWHSLLHDVEPLLEKVTIAQQYSSEMEFDLGEATEVLGRLTEANTRFKSQKGLQAAVCDLRQDKTALAHALEDAEEKGVSDKVLEAGRERLRLWTEEHERAAHHDELFTALRALERHLKQRDSPGAGVDEQRRLRTALAGSGLPPENPLAMQAALALKHWEAANGSLRAEARLRSAVQRAALGYQLNEPQAGDLLGSAIADVSQRGVDAQYLQEGREVLGRWQESRLRQAKKDLNLALQYKDEEHLKEALVLGKEAGVDQSLLEEAARCLQRLRWEEEVSKLLEAAVESDEPELLERAIQHAHEGCFIEAEMPLLLSASLQLQLRFWDSEIRSSILLDATTDLSMEVSRAEQRLAESTDALGVLKKAGAGDVAIRTLERDMRGLELIMPKARKRVAVYYAESELKRVLGAVERHAAELPAVIAAAEKQLEKGPQNVRLTIGDLDTNQLHKAKIHLAAYNATVDNLEELVAETDPDSDYAEDLKEALIKARLAGAPDALISSTYEMMDNKFPEIAFRARVELELLVALQEADDIDVLSAEGRFLRLQEAADEAKHLQPPLEEELMEHVSKISVALAAERTFVLAVAEGKRLLAGNPPASPQQVLTCAESLQRACTGAEQDAQDEAKKEIPEAQELVLQLKTEAQDRKELLKAVEDAVQARGSSAVELRQALIAAREGFLPGDLLAEAYAKLRRRKLEGITISLNAALELRQPALARALWQRGHALGAKNERSGDDWRSGKYQNLERPGPNSCIIRGSFTTETCGGSFGTRSWRRNPCYVVKKDPEFEKMASRASAKLKRAQTIMVPKIRVAIAEVGAQPANLSVHVVQNCEEAAEAGCKSLLVPGYQVLASSQDEDEVANCTFELMSSDDDRPVFIVPSAARAEEGSFVMFVESNCPVVVEEVPESLRHPWKFEKSIKIEWLNRGATRPSANMGGGRTAGTAPVLPWYRNPQLCIMPAAPAAAPAAPNEAPPEGNGNSAASKERTLVLAILTPEEAVDNEPAAVHILRNKAADADKPTLAENPELHQVVACSGEAGKEYSRASEVGAVCRLPLDGQRMIVVPSLETRKCEGSYTLQILATDEVVVDQAS